MIKTMSSKIDVSYHCKTELKEKTFCYTWSIVDFWKIHEYGVALDSNIKDLTFSMIFHQDKLKFMIFNHNEYSSFFDTGFYSVFLGTNEGKVCKIRNVKCSVREDSAKLLYDLFISYLSDNQTKYLPNGTLTIYFEFHIFVELIYSSINHSYRTLATGDTDIFVPNEISNQFVTFVVDKELTLQANKILLCLKSKVFKAMFDCGLKESQTNEIEITDIRYNILKELLSFVQTGHLSTKLEEINIDTIFELFITADKYDIEDLKLKCELYLITNTTIENVVEHLKIAHLNNGTILEKYAKEFIKLYYKDIMDTPNFITLMQEYPELLIQIKNTKLKNSQLSKSDGEMNLKYLVK